MYIIETKFNHQYILLKTIVYFSIIITNTLRISRLSGIIIKKIRIDMQITYSNNFTSPY